MSWITLDVDIDIDEFLSNCSKKDIKYIIECLIEDGHLNQEVLKENLKVSEQNHEWDNVIQKLQNSRHQLTLEEENN
jgi:hypothetical protein